MKVTDLEIAKLIESAGNISGTPLIENATPEELETELTSALPSLIVGMICAHHLIAHLGLSTDSLFDVIDQAIKFAYGDE